MWLLTYVSPQVHTNDVGSKENDATMQDYHEIILVQFPISILLEP